MNGSFSLKKLGELVPAKAIPSKQIAYIPFGGEEIPKYDYHVSERSEKLRIAYVEYS